MAGPLLPNSLGLKPLDPNFTVQLASKTPLLLLTFPSWTQKVPESIFLPAGRASERSGKRGLPHGKLLSN
jgi:hypothetical protein